MHMRYLAAVLAACVPLSLATEARAMACSGSPLPAVAQQADAILSGKIREVDYSWQFSSGGACETHSDDDPKCGPKVAEIDVIKVWKGEVNSRVRVFSEDGCYCLGTYFSEGEERLFILERHRGLTNPFNPVEYQTALCAPAPLLESAEADGTLRQLNTLLGLPKPMQ